MNNAPLDYVLQLPVPRPETAPAALRPRDDAPAFDDQFRRAADPRPPATAPAAAAAAQPAPARAARSSRPADDASEPTNAESPTSGTDSTVRAAAGENQERDGNEDAPADEATEVAAVLAAAGQLVKVAGDESTAAIELDVPAHDVDSAAGKHTKAANAEARATRTPAADATTATKSAANSEADAIDLPAHPANVNDAAAAALKPGQAAANAAAAPDASVDATAAHGDEGQGTPRRDKILTGKVDVHTAAQARDVTNTATADGGNSPARAIDPRVAQQAPPPESTADEKSGRRDKRPTARTSIAPSDAATTSSDRAQPAARVADAAAVAPVVADVQVPAAAAGDAATAASATTLDERNSAAKDGPLSPLARLDRGDAKGIRTGGRAGHTEGGPHVDPARFVSRVARAVQTAQERGGPLHLRLSPPELGSMRIELTVNHGTLSATIETDNHAARQLLVDNLPLLRDRLADQNVRIERFDVDVRSDSGGFQQNRGPQDGSAESRHARSTQQNTSTRREIELQVGDQPAPIHRSITNTTINVIA